MDAAIRLSGIRRSRTSVIASAPGAARPRLVESPHRPATTATAAQPNARARWMPWIFAGKTAAAGLLALLIAFAFDLDQPKWALLTVFISAQPQSGMVLAKSFYRMIGTLIGAAGALVLVALFAQERELFLGALALWVGLCTYGAKRARNFAAYGFVLSGYTVAIVGIPAALAPASAFFLAVARVSEIAIGIGATAAISHLVLPVSLADALRRAIPASRSELAAYATALLDGSFPGSWASDAQGAKLLGQAMAIESQRAAAVFEDRDIRARSGALRSLATAMLGAIEVARLLGTALERLTRAGAVVGPGFGTALARAANAIALWRREALDAEGLSRAFRHARAALPLARDLLRESACSDDDIVDRTAAIARLREFLTAFHGFAVAWEAATRPQQPRASVRTRFPGASDGADALWAGVRTALALALAATFWIETNWASGPTAVVLATVLTALMATREHAARAAAGGTIASLLAALPAFVLVEVALPRASGFAMFALMVGPAIFFLAALMAHEKTAGLGFIAALYFANVGAFQDRMAYDPIGFVNTSIAFTLALAAAAVLFATVAPDTAPAVRCRFARVACRALRRIVRRRRGWTALLPRFLRDARLRRAPQDEGYFANRPQRLELAAFETVVVESLQQLRRALPAGHDAAAIEAGMTVLDCGRELIRVRDDGRPDKRAVAAAVIRALGERTEQAIDHARRTVRAAIARRVRALREDRIGVADAREAARELVAYAAIRDVLERDTHRPIAAPSARRLAHAA
jgi:uncharacterized membrane protein YccC